MIAAPGISVNGIKITIEQINAEVQYHPANSLPEAKYEAMKALVIRELLLQRAVKLGICRQQEMNGSADQIIDQLLEREIKVPEPTREECERYYRNNSARFVSAPLFEVSHILYLAPPDDREARLEAQKKAERCLQKVLAEPGIFSDMARAESACSSGKLGGSLGQISKGQTMPGFEAALLSMQEHEISREPVATEVGFHIIQVHRRIDGKSLPFDMVEEWIVDFLKQKSWQSALNQYIQILVGQAEISGFRLKGAETPLVQ